MKRMLGAALAASLALAAIAAAEPPAMRRLRYDPFDWSVLQRAVDRKEAEAAAPTQTPSAVPAAPPRTPRLRALMLAPSGARVDLEGAILGVGESADGYRLVEVREQSAVFSKNGKTVEIELSRERSK